MATRGDEVLRSDLVERRHRLEAAMTQAGETTHLRELLHEVDAALERVERGNFGLCEACHEPIEADRLAVNPLLCFCLDHLTPAERRVLQDDLELAARIQSELLPQRHLRAAGWEVSYHYEPMGPVSGDYCDLIQPDGEALFFVLGDASGKGVAASILMSQLHAIFRTLITLGLPADQLLERANRIFCDARLPGHHATLVCGRADKTGRVELANAGHCPPLLVQARRATPLEPTGLPLGLFCNSRYGVTTLQLAGGENLLLYTDGLSEARNASGAEYGSARLAGLAAEHASGEAGPPALVSACLEDLAAFRSGARRHDDLTLMVIQRVG